MNYSGLFSRMIVLFLTLAVGYFSGKRRIMTEESNLYLSKFLVKVANPLLVISSVLSGEHPLSNLQVLELTLVSVCCYIVIIALSFLIPPLLGRQRDKAGVYRFIFIFSNTGFIGYPVVEALFGKSALFYVTVFVLTFQFFCWSYGVNIMQEGHKKFRFNPKMLLHPCIVSALLAYLIYFTGMKFPSIVGDAVSYVGDLTSPVSMLVIGCALAQMPLKKVFGNWKLYVLAAAKMILVPVAAYYCLRPILHDPMLLGISVVILCMPAASSTTVISYEYGGDVDLASAGVFITTLLSIVSIPTLMYLLFR
jgi:predicted permease